MRLRNKDSGRFFFVKTLYCCDSISLLATRCVDKDFSLEVIGNILFSTSLSCRRANKSGFQMTFKPLIFLFVKHFTKRLYVASPFRYMYVCIRYSVPIYLYRFYLVR